MLINSNQFNYYSLLTGDFTCYKNKLYKADTCRQSGTVNAWRVMTIILHLLGYKHLLLDIEFIT